MDEIRSWWEVPCIAHYCYLFRQPFKLPDFDIEDIEDSLLVDHQPNPSTLLKELHIQFLKGILGKSVGDDDWEVLLKLHLQWRCDNLEEKYNPLPGDKPYKALTTREKMELLYRLCLWRLELNDIGDRLRNSDGMDMRVEPLGRDSEGNCYWYFIGTRLYKESLEHREKWTSIKKEGVAAGKARGGRGGSIRTPRKRGGGAGRRVRRSIPIKDVENDSKKGDVEDEEDMETDSKQTEEMDTGGTTTIDRCIEPGWSILCSSADEWQEAIETLKNQKLNPEKQLARILEQYLPDIEEIISERIREMKRRELEDMPRRHSDRLAIKAVLKVEEERQLALEREKHREEDRTRRMEEREKKKLEEEIKRQQRREEALKRAEAQEEEQSKIREEEEKNWEMAMSGNLSGPRRAAIGAAQSVAEVAKTASDAEEEDDELSELYISLFKVVEQLRKHDDAWVFIDPVTEDIAPGYFEIVEKPMDIVTIEKNLAEKKYQTHKEFVEDVNLIFSNCEEYNGDESEYTEMAHTMRKYFKQLVKKHLEFESTPTAAGRRKKRKKTDDEESDYEANQEEEPESESEEEEEENDNDSDFEGGLPSKRNKRLSVRHMITKADQYRMAGSGGPGTMPGGPPNMTPEQQKQYMMYMHQQRIMFQQQRAAAMQRMAGMHQGAPYPSQMPPGYRQPPPGYPGGYPKYPPGYPPNYRPPTASPHPGVPPYGAAPQSGPPSSGDTPTSGQPPGPPTSGPHPHNAQQQPHPYGGPAPPYPGTSPGYLPYPHMPLHQAPGMPPYRYPHSAVPVRPPGPIPERPASRMSSGSRSEEKGSLELASEKGEEVSTAEPDQSPAASVGDGKVVNVEEKTPEADDGKPVKMPNPQTTPTQPSHSPANDSHSHPKYMPGGQDPSAVASYYQHMRNAGMPPAPSAHPYGGHPQPYSPHPHMQPGPYPSMYANHTGAGQSPNPSASVPGQMTPEQEAYLRWYRHQHYMQQQRAYKLHQQHQQQQQHHQQQKQQAQMPPPTSEVQGASEQQRPTEETLDNSDSTEPTKDSEDIPDYQESLVKMAMNIATPKESVVSTESPLKGNEDQIDKETENMSSQSVSKEISTSNSDEAVSSSETAAEATSTSADTPKSAPNNVKSPNKSTATSQSLPAQPKHDPTKMSPRVYPPGPHGQHYPYPTNPYHPPYHPASSQYMPPGSGYMDPSWYGQWPPSESAHMSRGYPPQPYPYHPMYSPHQQPPVNPAAPQQHSAAHHQPRTVPPVQPTKEPDDKLRVFQETMKEHLTMIQGPGSQVVPPQYQPMMQQQQQVKQQLPMPGGMSVPPIGPTPVQGKPDLNGESQSDGAQSDSLEDSVVAKQIKQDSETTSSNETQAAES